MSINAPLEDNTEIQKQGDIKLATNIIKNLAGGGHITPVEAQQLSEKMKTDLGIVMDELREKYIRYIFRAGPYYIEKYDARSAFGSWNDPHFDPIKHEAYAHEVDISFKVMIDILRQHVRKGDRVLDLGCGTGLSSLPIIEKGAVLVGADGCQKMLDTFLEKGGDKVEGAVKVMLNENTELPFKDGEFDHVASNGVLYYIVGGIESTIRECARIVRPPDLEASRDGGMLHFSITCPPGKHNEWVFPDGSVVNYEMLSAHGTLAFYYRKTDIIDMLHRNGFEPIEIFDKKVHRENNCKNSVVYTYFTAKKVR